MRKAIDSLVNQTLPKERYEILVVDNSSTDNTKQVVLREFSNLQNLQYLYEPVLRLSQAQNTSWCNARGEYVAYLDDNAIACPHWLEKIFDVFETVKPKPACVSGKIKPTWEIPKACNHFTYQKLDLPLEYDVTFVGQPYGNRRDYPVSKQ